MRDRRDASLEHTYVYVYACMMSLEWSISPGDRAATPLTSMRVRHLQWSADVSRLKRPRHIITVVPLLLPLVGSRASHASGRHGWRLVVGLVVVGLVAGLMAGLMARLMAGLMAGLIPRRVARRRREGGGDEGLYAGARHRVVGQMLVAEEAGLQAAAANSRLL